MTPTAHRQLVTIAIDGTQTEGTLAMPVGASRMVLFAHGSGSSRHSPRNNAVAAELRSAGIGTLLMDLLGPDEDHDTAPRFDIDLLTRRLGAAADWLADNSATRALPLGLFGASNRRCRRAGAGRATRAGRAGGGGARRAARPGRRARTDSGAFARAAHRWRARYRGRLAQQSCLCPARLRQIAGGGAWRHPSVRGARAARHCGAPGHALVPAPFVSGLNPYAWRTSTTGAPVIACNCAGVRLNTACGWPAAAHTLA